MSRKPFIAGNWKMYKTIPESLNLAKKLSLLVKDIHNRDILICPPLTTLYSVYQIIKDTNIILGAQNMHWEAEGAFTGEVSPVMLKDCGCKFVIIGHSERRQYFHETNETINKKIKSALKHELVPIVCVGEKLEEREKGITEKIVETQIKEGLQGLSTDEMANLVIAYEPVWAIGTGRTATPDDADRVHSFIRNLLSELFNSKVAEKLRILYGGSVKPDNIDKLMEKENIDGVLVGGASLSPESFARIIKFE